MILFLLKRIASGIFILFSVVTVVFFLFSFSFPSPEKMAVGQRTDKATQDAIKKEFGLDQPIFTQYRLFLNDISPISFHSGTKENLKEKYNYGVALRIGNHTILLKKPFLRRSFQSRERTEVLIANAFKGTFVLALVSIIVAGIFGIILGVFAGIKVNSFLDQAAKGDVNG